MWGGNLDDALFYIAENELLLERCFEYEADEIPCRPVCGDRLGIDDYYHIPETYSDLEMINQIKKVIKNNGPVTLGIRVFRSYRDYTNGVYQHIDGENVVSNHGVVLLGYNDDLRAFRIKDSHGTDWGEDGYAWISYDECCGDEVDGDLEKKAMVKKSIYGVLTK